MNAAQRLALIVLGTLVLAACGGESAGSESDSETPTSTTVQTSTSTPATATSPSDQEGQEVQVGDTAVWRLDTNDPADATADSFTALVTRLGCNGGITGQVFDPTIEIEPTEIIVTFSVEPVAGGDCPSNDEVPVTVELGEAIGERAVFDGACLGGEATTTSFCTDDGGRRIN